MKPSAASTSPQAINRRTSFGYNSPSFSGSGTTETTKEQQEIFDKMKERRQDFDRQTEEFLREGSPELEALATLLAMDRLNCKPAASVVEDASNLGEEERRQLNKAKSKVENLKPPVGAAVKERAIELIPEMARKHGARVPARVMYDYSQGPVANALRKIAVIMDLSDEIAELGQKWRSMRQVGRLGVPLKPM